jgi:hypothetical protein
MTDAERNAILERRLSGEKTTDLKKRLGVIGTAGRRDDGPRLTKASFDRMCDIARAVIGTRRYTHLVSGGAAWADHVAVALALDGTVAPRNLLLHLPARLVGRTFDESSRDGGTANYYHRLFAQKTGIDSLGQILQTMTAGTEVRINTSGFIARNGDVARDADGLLAFTFGTGEPWRAKVHGNVTAEAGGVKDGGTSNTWSRCKASEKIHVALA